MSSRRMGTFALVALSLLSAPKSWGLDGFVMNLNAMDVSLEVNLAAAQEAATLGATHFTIPVTLCQKDRHSDQMRWCNVGREPVSYEHRLRTLVTELSARGWTVGVFPFPMAEDGSWRGNFEPRNFSTWSSHYLTHLMELSRWLKGLPITDFIVGSELTVLYRKSDLFWRGALHSVRSSLNCRAFVVANWDSVDQIHFWDASDFIGTSSYFPLADNSTSDTSVEALSARWARWTGPLIALSRRTGRKLYFAELGYASRSEAAQKPWDYALPARLDLDLQSRLFLAFARVWSRVPELARFTVWALENLEAPLKDTGFSVTGKPAARAVAHAFQSRLALASPHALSTPVTFAMDDLPMWFVPESSERVAAYQLYRQLFEKHAIPAVGFVNSAFIQDSDLDHRERDELRIWLTRGFFLGNHGARHVAFGHSGETAFLRDVDAGDAQMTQLLPGWDTTLRLFRFPNLEVGAEVALRSRRYQILDVTLDSRDWSWSEAYHRADAQERAVITQAALATIRSQFLDARLHHTDKTPLTLLLHSTEFMRDHLEEVLTLLESLGARWAMPAHSVVHNVKITRDAKPKALLQTNAISNHTLQ